MRTTLDFEDVVDLFCGTGDRTNTLASIFPNADVLGIDVVHATTVPADRVVFTTTDAYPPLSIASETADFVFSTSPRFSTAPGHRERNKWLIEIDRILEKDGIAIIATDLDRNYIFEEWSTMFDVANVSNGYAFLRSIRGRRRFYR
ncbi:class I SAM-dependent methyltransferase [Rhodopseudomonas sp. NSM]|uniref:class I SAM-dependent methyltransferase n=1 Tax=Rhodopseudomonas sp. NSM TaxID=3457630 RepID=UPI004035197A